MIYVYVYIYIHICDALVLSYLPGSWKPIVARPSIAWSYLGILSLEMERVSLGWALAGGPTGPNELIWYEKIWTTNGEEVVKLGSRHLILTAVIGFMVDLKNERDRFLLFSWRFPKIGGDHLHSLIHSHPANKRKTCNNLHLYFLLLQEHLMWTAYHLYLYIYTHQHNERQRCGFFFSPTLQCLSPKRTRRNQKHIQLVNVRTIRIMPSSFCVESSANVLTQIKVDILNRCLVGEKSNGQGFFSRSGGIERELILRVLLLDSDDLG